MGTKIVLRVIDCGNGEWKFDIIRGMNDEEIRNLISRVKFIERELNDLLETDLIRITNNVEYLKEKKK